MKHFTLILSFLLLCSLASATLIPLSDAPVLGDDNCFSDFVRIDPDDRRAEPLSTKFWLWQDENDLMIYAEMEIDEDFEKGIYSRRDNDNGGDMLRVQLITMPEAYMAYAYMAYPMGSPADGIRNQNMSIDYSWDSSYSYESLVLEDKWQVTMRIPLGELRFKQELPYNWRIIFTRYHREDNSTYSSPYANTDYKSTYFSSSHQITLEHRIKKDSALKFKPYFVKSYDLIEHTSSFDPQNVGLDLLYLPSQKMRAKLSFNPDFSDVPMDNATDTYNDKYPPYYYENRFFFTEDLQVFNLQDYFYTRNIVQPKVAFKATGNAGKVNWGVLGALDKEIKDEYGIISPGDYYQAISVNPSWQRLSLQTSLISRMNTDFYNHGFLGGLSYQPYDWLGYSALVLAATQKEESEAKAHDDILTRHNLTFDKGDFVVDLGYNYVGADLRHDAGYIYDTDYDGLSLAANWDNVSPESFINSKGINTFFSLSRSSLKKDSFDLDSEMIYAYIHLKRKLMLYASFDYMADTDLNMDIHRTGQARIGFNYFPNRQLLLGASVRTGKSLIYALSEVHDHTDLTATATLRLARRMTLNYYGIMNFYGYPRENEIEIADGVFFPLKLDDKYSIHNLSLVYMHSETFSLSGGVGLSTYERGNSFAELSYYTNLSYEFIPGNFLYLGIKSRQNQTEKQTFSNMLPHYRKDMASAYLKVAFSL